MSVAGEFEEKKKIEGGAGNSGQSNVTDMKSQTGKKISEIYNPTIDPFRRCREA